MRAEQHTRADNHHKEEAEEERAGCQLARSALRTIIHVHNPGVTVDPLQLRVH